MAENRITITEIAQRCGVSAQTVSRVINNRPDVAPATRHAVAAAIEATGYRPSALARGLVNRRSRMLGVVVGGLGNVGVSLVLNGITQASQEADYGLLLCGIHDDARPNLSGLIEMLLSHHVEGIVFASPATDWNQDIETQFPKQMPPVVFTKRRAVGTHTVLNIDNVAAAALAVRHLLSLGRRAPAHISGPHQWLEARERVDGWNLTMGDTRFDARRIVEGDWSSASGERAMEEILRRWPETDAVFVANDQMAMGAMRVAEASGRKIPEDVAVVGFDGVPEGAYLRPSLTTVQQPLAELGAYAVRRLLDEINTTTGVRAGDEIVLDVELILRESAPAQL